MIPNSADASPSLAFRRVCKHAIFSAPIQSTIKAAPQLQSFAIPFTTSASTIKLARRVAAAAIDSQPQHLCMESRAEVWLLGWAAGHGM